VLVADAVRDFIAGRILLPEHHEISVPLTPSTHNLHEPLLV